MVSTEKNGRRNSRESQTFEEFTKDRNSSRRGSGRSRDNSRRGSDRGSSDRGSFGRRGSDRRGSDRRGSDRIEMTKVVCDKCKKNCEVPFKPTSSKPIFCNECFKDNGSSKSQRSGESNKELESINKKLDIILKALELD
ncbi:hypothetical protein HOA59_00800 [archaeon]|nr:hypothetical protein [archaeon]MBT7297742.1 hypothetical protein [archaeon]